MNDEENIEKLKEIFPEVSSWEKIPSINDLKQNITDAEIDQQTWINKVNNWLEKRAAYPKKNKNRSNIVPKVVRKQNEWRYSSLSDPFLSTSDLFNIYPTSAGDVRRARQNNLILNKQFNTEIRKVAFIDEYVRDVVDTGTAIIKVGWESKTATVLKKIPQYEYIEDTSGQLVQQYDQLLQLMQTDPEAYADMSTQGLDHALAQYAETGIPLFVKETGKIVETEVEEEIENHPTVDLLPIDNIIADSSCGGDYTKAKFIGEKERTCLSDLTESGKYKNLSNVDIEAVIDAKNDPEFRDTSSANALSFSDKARKQFVMYTYWGEYDIWDDGTTEQIVVSWVGDAIIRMELNPYPDNKPPFIFVPYMPVRGSIYGEPDAELLGDNQDIIGAVMRGTIDLLGKAANSQTGMSKQFLDVTNRRRFKNGEDYEFNGNADPRQAVYQHKYPEIPRSVFDLIGLQNNEAESLTGVKAFNSGISGQSLGSVATGVRGALDAASKRELGILRRLAQGIIDLGYKIIAMNSEFLSEEETVRITATQFVQVRRDDLAGKYDLRLSISTAEEDNAKAQELSFMLQTIGNSMDFAATQMILEEIARLKKMPDLAKKIATYQPQPDPIAQMKAQKEIELLEAQITKERALAYKHQAEGNAAGGRGARDASQADLNEAKIQEVGAKANHLNAVATKTNIDATQQGMGVKHAQELEKKDRQAQNDMLIESIKHSSKEE